MIEKFDLEAWAEMIRKLDGVRAVEVTPDDRVFADVLAKSATGELFRGYCYGSLITLSGVMFTPKLEGISEGVPEICRYELLPPFDEDAQARRWHRLYARDPKEGA